MKRLSGTRFTDGSDKSDVFMTLLLFCLINRCLFRLPLIYSCSRSRLRDRLGRLNGRLIHCAGKSHVQEMREVGRLVFRKAKGSTAYQSTGLLAEIGHRENLAGDQTQWGRLWVGLQRTIQTESKLQFRFACRDFLRKVACGPMSANTAFFYADRGVGGLGFIPLVEEADIWTLARALQLLDSKDQSVSDVAMVQLEESIKLGYGRNEVPHSQLTSTWQARWKWTLAQYDTVEPRWTSERVQERPQYAWRGSGSMYPAKNTARLSPTTSPPSPSKQLEDFGPRWDRGGPKD
jgi:hypothetical protein